MMCTAFEAKIKGHLSNVPLTSVASLPEQVGVPMGFWGCPDLPDREIATKITSGALASITGYDEEYCGALIGMHRRMLDATGSGSFPAGCYADLWPNNHAATVFWDWDSFPSQYHRAITQADLNWPVFLAVWGVTLEEASDLWIGKPQIRVTAELCRRAYRRVGIALEYVDTGPNGEHNIHVLAKPIPGSVIGYAYFNNGTCGDHVTCNIDSTWNPGLHNCTQLLAHELGHNNNLEHEFTQQSYHRGVMSYEWQIPFVGFSPGGSPYDRPLDPSLAVLKRYYGDPILDDDDDPTSPPPPPPPNTQRKIEIKVDGQSNLFYLDSKGVLTERSF